MLSRVAENIYWLARYVERAENTARLVSVNANLLLDLPRTVRPGWDRWSRSPAARSSSTTSPPLRRARRGAVPGRANERNPGSMLQLAECARENAAPSATSCRARPGSS